MLYRINFSLSKEDLTKITLGFGLLPLIMAISIMAGTASAQPTGTVGLGGQVGDPSGVTLKFREPNGVSYDFLAAWDTGDFLFLNVHGLFERPLGTQGNVHWFYGPGAFVGIRDRGRRNDDDVVLGVSAAIGVGVLVEHRPTFGPRPSDGWRLWRRHWSPLLLLIRKPGGCRKQPEPQDGQTGRHARYRIQRHY